MISVKDFNAIFNRYITTYNIKTVKNISYPKYKIRSMFNIGIIHLSLWSIKRHPNGIWFIRFSHLYTNSFDDCTFESNLKNEDKYYFIRTIGKYRYGPRCEIKTITNVMDEILSHKDIGCRYGLR